MPAQKIASLPQSKIVRTGKLECGINYYLVTNTTIPHQVDMALVQKVGTLDEDVPDKGFTVVHARSSLTDLPHFTSSSPLSFMTQNGIWPDKNGYVDIGEDATVFHFREIDTELKTNAVDSTLLMIFDIIEKEADHMQDRYIPQNQAIVISGDIDPAVVLGKMYMLSMLVAKKPGSAVKLRTEAADRENAILELRRAPSKGTAAVQVDYAMSRIPPQNMGTVQGLVNEKLVGEMGVVLTKRIRKALRDQGFPVADITYNYTPSNKTSGNEHVGLTVTTTPDRLTDATRLIARILSELDRAGVDAEEYRDAVAEHGMARRSVSIGDALPNSGYVDRCISSFLYGSPLSAPSDELAFFLKRNVDEGLSHRLFNDFLKAVLDRKRNLTITAYAPTSVGEGLLRAFDSAWSTSSMSSNTIYVPEKRDTALLKRNIPKMKIALDNDEPLSGGRMWTFTNGIKVIYKKAPSGTEGMFNYCWLLKSGYSHIKDLKQGEGAYIADMLWQSSFSGISSNSFRNILTANGIGMDASVSISDFTLSGYAPSSKIDLLMKSLLSIANERRVDKDAYDRYRANEALRRDMARGSLEYRKAVLDSIMNPTSEYSPYKKPIELPDNFKEKCEALYERVFSKMNDGVLIIVGNFDEEALKKTLSQYMGGFRTDKVATYRARSINATIRGTQTKWDIADEPSLDICLSTPLPFTVENFLAGRMVAYLLEDEIGKEISRVGWHLSSDWSLEMFPEERFFLSIYMDPSDQRGLPATTLLEDDVERVLQITDKAIQRLSSKGIRQSDLNNLKKMANGAAARWNTSPEMIINFLVLRYSLGKDLMTDQAAKINAVALPTMNRILSDLAHSSYGRYAIRKRHTEEVITPSNPVLEHKISVSRLDPYSITDRAGNVGVYWELLQGLPDADTTKDSWWSIRELERILPVRTMPIALPAPGDVKPKFEQEGEGELLEEEIEELQGELVVESEEKEKQQEEEKTEEQKKEEGEETEEGRQQ